jgi:hypothetical protein
MDEWADLYGEWDAAEPSPPKPSRGAVYCQRCDCYVEKSEIKPQLADDDTWRFPCPGCDEELFPPESMEG